MARPETPALTVDAIIAAPERGIVLIRRRNAPFRGQWALPGGFVEPGETCEAACIREAAEETGLTIRVISLAGVYSTPGRDPRGATVSVVYLCAPVAGAVAGGDDASEAAWFPSLAGVTLAFDHREILADGGFLSGEAASPTP